MHQSTLGRFLLAIAATLAFVGVLYLSMSWIVVAVSLLCVFVYARVHFSIELRRTDLQVERVVLGDMAFTDEAAAVRVTIINKGTVEVRGVFEDDIPRECELAAGQNVVRVVLPPQSRLTMSYSIIPRKRGHHIISRMSIASEDVFGLYGEDQDIAQVTTINVHTRRDALQTARRMAGREHLEFYGPAKNPALVLRELDFDGIRDYIPGDRARDVHWKVLPKLGKLMTKMYRREGLLQTMIFIDAGRSMRIKTHTVAKIDHALDLAAQISYVLLASLHPAGVAIFDEVRTLEKTDPNARKHQFERIATILRNVPESLSAGRGQTDATESPVPARRTTGNSAEGANEFLTTVERISKARVGKSMGLGLEGAVNEQLTKGKGQSFQFIVITDLISSRDTVIAGARVCKRTGNKMLIIHTYDDWYRMPGDMSEPQEMERLYENMSKSIETEALARALGATYIRIGPADTASGIVRAVRRGRT